MRTSLLKTNTLQVFINDYYTIDADEYRTEICTHNRLKIEMCGQGYFIWPNREGEGARIEDIRDKFSELGVTNSGLSLSYPATASMKALLILSDEGSCLAIHAPADPDGRVCEVLMMLSDSAVIVDFQGTYDQWNVWSFDNYSELKAAFKTNYLLQEVFLHQFQIGFIGPDGKTDTLLSEGFSVLGKLSRTIARVLDPAKVRLHLFGYAQGHDIGYPDYEPSRLLGGYEKLCSVIEEVHTLGFSVSMYLNARIAQKDVVIHNPSLLKAVSLDGKGYPVIENYHGYEYFVMDPNVAQWREHLLKTAKRLISAGADILQLDQIAGRKSPKAVGSMWGQGYVQLIQEIQAEGSEVWIQGVSDVYPADWFEMTYRDVSILEGGIVRGGNPIGVNDVRLMQLFMPNAGCIVPALKLGQIPMDSTFRIIIDEMGSDGRLPLYDEMYLEELNKVLTGYTIRSGGE